MSSSLPGETSRSAKGMKPYPSTINEYTDYADTGRIQQDSRQDWSSSYLQGRMHGMFKPLDNIVNPLGLCRFYRTDPQKSNVIMGPKSMASTHKIKRLLQLAKELKWPLTVVVFEDGMVTPLGLLQKLHSRLTLSHIAIHTPEEAKVGQKNCMCLAAPYVHVHCQK